MAPTATEEKKEETKPKAVASFNTDDKRAQYARLAVFNWGCREKIIGKDDGDVNSVSQALLTKAADSLADGTVLNGTDGIELIQKLTKDGATDPKVAQRGLTTAYAQEVRPFLRRKQLSPNFGRRGGLSDEEKAERERKRAEEKAAREKEKIDALAKKEGIDISKVKGTGEKGAVTLGDVREAVKAKKAEEKKRADEAKQKAEAEAKAAAANKS